MHMGALLHLYMHATACVHQRSKVTVRALPPLTTFLIITHLPALNHPLLYAAHIPIAQDVSTRSVPGNDPFTMATTNKEKIPLVRGKASKGGRGQREREGESWQEVKNAKRPGRRCTPTKGLWQLGWKISLPPDVVVVLVAILQVPSARTPTGQSAFKLILVLRLHGNEHSKVITLHSEVSDSFTETLLAAVHFLSQNCPQPLIDRWEPYINTASVNGKQQDCFFFFSHHCKSNNFVLSQYEKLCIDSSQPFIVFAFFSIRNICRHLADGQLSGSWCGWKIEGPPRLNRRVMVRACYSSKARRRETTPAETETHSGVRTCTVRRVRPPALIHHVMSPKISQSTSCKSFKCYHMKNKA